MNMKKAGFHQLLLFCLCICLGIFLAGCSSQDSQKSDASDSVEYQAEKEASDIGPDDSDGSTQQGQDGTTEPLESSAELHMEETLNTDDWTVYDYGSMEHVLAAMVFSMQEGEVNRYYRDRADDNLAVNYLYAYVNMFDHDTFETVSMKGKTHESYVKLQADYLKKLLAYAFGNTITVDRLKGDGDLVLKKGSDFYVALDEVQPVLVDYTGFENEDFTESTVFPFDYELYLDNGDTEDGIMQVRFEESEEVESGIILRVVAVTRY